MSTQPSHRGAAPEDLELFASEKLPRLREALNDLCWLLDRGYAVNSAIELVGNRYDLVRRQRLAVMRCAADAESLLKRRAKQVTPLQMAGQVLWIDGFNVIMALEVALSGGVILRGCDGCCRDVAGVHARYRKVDETLPAIRLLGESMAVWGVKNCLWWLDKPISNSGRLKNALLEVADANGWNWSVELVFSPDKVLSESNEIIATADSVIIDHCRRWLNLASVVISEKVPQARVVCLDQGLTPNAFR